jgi:uncharacterized protein (TIGR02117 family)
MRKFFKYFFIVLTGTILLFAIGFFVPRKWLPPEPCIEETVNITIGSNGYHTSFILPVKTNIYSWNKDFPAENDIQYIEFSWGNKNFYMNRDFSIKAAARAMLPSSTVMHIVYLDKEPEKWFKKQRLKNVTLCKPDYLTLVNYIKNSFAVDSSGNKIYLGEGLYGPSAFYEGTGNYYALETCNTWVAKGLRAADVNTPLWAGTAQSIMRQLD